jgi:hypothetical protein
VTLRQSVFVCLYSVVFTRTVDGCYKCFLVTATTVALRAPPSPDTPSSSASTTVALLQLDPLASRSCSSPTSRENLTSMKKAAPGPADEAVIKLLSKVGVTLEQALNSQELKWSSKHLDADDAHVVAHIVASSTVLQKLVLGANSIGDAGASSIAEALANSQPYASQAWHPLALICTCHHSRFPTPAPPGAQGQQRVAHACSW